MKIGIGRANITPPVGVPLVGYAGRGDSTGVHDPLYTTVLAATDNGTTILLVDCDLLGICADITAEIRAEIETRTGVPGSRTMISCTHTHYGPNVYSRGERPDEIAYQEHLKFAIAGAAVEAMESRCPANSAVGYGTSDIGVNRREKIADGSIILGHNPDGPIDRSVGVLRIDSVQGDPIASMVNFATHPVSQGSKTRTISADYPGKTRQIVEGLTGAPCLFLQGACANINATLKDTSYEPARTLGTRLGCEAVRVWETISPVDTYGVCRVEKQVALPRYRYQSVENAERLSTELESEIATLRQGSGDAGTIYWAEHRLENIRKAVQSWKTGFPDEPVDAELGAVKIGNLAIASAPGEIFCQIGQQIKESSPFENTFFAGYSGGTIGYVPVPEAYAEGGYEVTHACRVDPEAAGLIVEHAVALISGLR